MQYQLTQHTTEKSTIIHTHRCINGTCLSQCAHTHVSMAHVCINVKFLQVTLWLGLRMRITHRKTASHFLHLRLRLRWEGDGVSQALVHKERPPHTQTQTLLQRVQRGVSHLPSFIITEVMAVLGDWRFLTDVRHNPRQCQVSAAWFPTQAEAWQT